MIGGEAIAVGVRAEIGQPQGVGIAYEQAQYPPSGRAGSDALLLVLREPDGHELLEGRALLVQNPERPVLGTRHGARLFDDMAQERRELEIGLEQECGLEHPAELDGILDRSIWHKCRG